MPYLVIASGRSREGVVSRGVYQTTSAPIVP